MSSPAFPTALIEQLRQATGVVVLTGAGISAESGVPTFREAQTGLWARYDPKELATPAAFKRDPALVWKWYQWRREITSGAQPNPGHVALAQMENHVPHFTLITQNIDGLHAMAGSKQVIELHGNLSRVKCFESDHIIPNWADLPGTLPRCPICDSQLRPDVVWFGESLPPQALHDAMGASQEADVFLVVGTSGIVHPAATLPLLAAEAGAVTVEINPEPTELSNSMTHILRGPSGTILPRLVSAVWGSETVT